MQVFGLPGHVIRNGRAASRLIAAKPPSSAAAIRRDALERWRLLMGRGLSAAVAAKGVGIARATLYRWQKRIEPKSRRPHRVRRPTWTGALVQTVERLRADYPMWGKAQDHRAAAPTRDRRSSHRRAHPHHAHGARPRLACAHAPAQAGRAPLPPHRRAPRPALAEGPQADPAGRARADRHPVCERRPRQGHQTLHRLRSGSGPPPRRQQASAASRAFLDQLLAATPFQITGIQVDGGSEFRAEFEQACAEKGLNLFVLPPKRPQLNGAVERAQSSWRYEFYACHDLPHRLDKLQPLVDAFAHHFNHHRPHQALGDRTPAEYLSTFSPGKPHPSHMC